MNVLLEEQIGALVLQLQAVRFEDGLTPLQETYTQLRKVFFHSLFQVNHCQDDNYAWLLINQDATYSLGKLSHLYLDWKQSGNNKDKVNYLHELDDFKWIIATACLCLP